MHLDYEKDTIDGVAGYWVDAELRKEKLNGFVFSPYLMPGDLVNKDLTKIRFTQPRQSDYEFDYHPKLNWYGLYFKGDTSYLEKVKIDLVLSMVDSSFDSNMANWASYPNAYLKTNLPDQSAFLIGTAGEMITGKITQLYKAKIIGFENSPENGFLYPEEVLTLYYTPSYFSFRGCEDAKIDTATYSIQKNYNIEVIGMAPRRDTLFSYKIGTDLKFCCEARRHVMYQTPQIYWAGDLNKDQLLDFIIYEHTMSDGCGVCWSYSLFLSNPSDQSNLPFHFIDTAVTCSD